MKVQFKISVAAMLFVLLTVFRAETNAQDWRLLFGLRGDWKFELGDDKRWAKTQFDDSKWETIFAPANWEDEGFPGYDGYAWYRKHFQANTDWKDKSLYLRLGRIDDVDEVYVNGKLVGATGTFPPDYETAYNVNRDYSIPSSYINIPGDNVIAVRVYDDELGGGIYEGKLGMYEDVYALVPDIQFVSEWKFSTGDNASWKEMNVDDSKWATIQVPAFWEKHGFPNYDGYAWYRMRFRVPAQLADTRMVLLLGNIDDYDETYLNGQLVGKTGTMGRRVRPGESDEWQQPRAYTIVPGQLLLHEDNVLAVRVYDGYKDGGIYKGPIGIVTRERYVRWGKEARRRFDSFWENFMKDFKIDIK